MKRAADKEARARSALVTTVATAAGAAMGVVTGLPLSTAKFQARFVRQGKEMYKDLPLPPPGDVVIEAESAPPPRQNASTGELTFAPGDDRGLAGLLRNFCPNGTAASNPDGGVLTTPGPCAAKAMTGKSPAHVAAATSSNSPACTGNAIKITIT